uniref:F-ATPase protein 6 n=1 Tax=Polytomella sp. Pringsheim 198.80 TaxID=37502 RepID=H8PGG3_9CHLO|nr:Chain M, Mitochondrial ATP synthase subunit 6 [Polytomella sp. Pringsheim 198.80]6RD4_M Chain M, Mitochondrial ATP synthase subunit 6 [Polytomella sp. Pringsheim 198.80]6RD5_M Chain M, Mitochondrial ATP synthase subunit 6 [Polytomella sp. Pringsheim 198.80]6RD7_M Chain M, Mitochondrial ATP synthase subunit 6 [Polytomella sp. Pringsheim 198.80]6RD8_M Chain M, Mitochondrial ATP synthase subunit 6 [Polytomella sp. Pringsheim 198.80]6RD9_M Chain M, Mitochondrial ATP synthase subunit 6 [Polytome
MSVLSSVSMGSRIGSSLLGRSSAYLAQCGFSTRSNLNGSIDTSSSVFQALSSDNENKPAASPLNVKLPGMSCSSILLPKTSRIAVPFGNQTMAMSSVRDVKTGSLPTNFLTGVYRFWRSQNPAEKPHDPVNDRLLPAVVDASDKRASIGTWATTFFCTIISCNLLGLMPFNEAPTSGLGFATGLGVSVWATATILGLSKTGFKFPGHFIPGGTPWPMAFIFVPLETISYTFRAVSLGVRLWVNMLAGHTLLHILTGMALALPFSLGFFSMVPATFGVCCLLSALVGLEYLVAVLQSGVFSILSTVYVGEFNHDKFIGPAAKIVKKIH